MHDEIDKVRALYEKLHGILGEFVNAKGGNNQKEREQRRAKRDSLVQKAEQIMLANEETKTILDGFDEYNYLDQRLTEDKYFEDDMHKFLNILQKEYNL